MGTGNRVALLTRASGVPATFAERGKRTLRSFVIPHIPHDDLVFEEVQSLCAQLRDRYGAIADVMAQPLETVHNEHAITLEHLRVGGFKERIVDPTLC